MDNVTFRTDKDLYDKFKIISTIKKEKVQNVLTKFIEKYVNNESYQNYLVSASMENKLDNRLSTLQTLHRDEIK